MGFPSAAFTYSENCAFPDWHHESKQRITLSLSLLTEQCWRNGRQLCVSTVKAQSMHFVRENQLICKPPPLSLDPLALLHSLSTSLRNPPQAPPVLICPSLLLLFPCFPYTFPTSHPLPLYPHITDPSIHLSALTFAPPHPSPQPHTSPFFRSNLPILLASSLPHPSRLPSRRLFYLQPYSFCGDAVSS